MSDDFYQAVLEHAPWGTIVASTELDGRCLYCNPEFTRITGYTLDDIPTVQDWIEHAYPDPAYRETVLGNWAVDTSPDHMGRDVIYRVACANGEDKQIQFRAGMIGGGRMIVTLLDVSRRVAAEQALRESEERYRTLVEASPLGIVLHSGGTIDFANAAAARIVAGGGPEGLVGQPVIEFVHPDDRETVVRRVRAIFEKGEPAPIAEERWVRTDGETIDVEVAGGPVQFQGQRASQVVFTDITERKRMQREQRAMDRHMQQAQRTESLALLAGGVAHDLNNLLVGILGHAELARRGMREPAPAEAHLQSIVDTAQRAADLAGQLLAYAGRRHLAFEVVDLGRVIEETRGLLEATIGKRAALTIELAPDLPPVEGDATQLRQILLNLVTNAADAVGEDGGRITLRTAAIAEPDPRLGEVFGHQRPGAGPHALLQVADDGHGMDDETRLRVFDPFFTTRATGRGLGLAAVLGIVRAHGGGISLTSGPGQGATFDVVFPAAVGGAVTTAEAVVPDDGWQGSGVALLVDDEEIVREVGASMLREAGFEVVTAAHGQEALTILRERPGRFSLVVLDLTMPGWSGERTLEEIQALRDDLPVVLSSGFDEADTARRFRDIDPAGFLQKPYTYDDLIRVLRRALS